MLTNAQEILVKELNTVVLY